MKFLDSNILAYAFYRNEHTIRCQNAIRAGGIIDTFNLVEAFFVIEKETGSRDAAQKSVRSLLKSSLNIEDLDINLVFEALKKASNSKLSIFDLMHYTCARIHDCDAIVSYDEDFDGLDIAREEP
ncbi:PIN domain-containing protein [Candidatus Woesearchaeota archaeon]|nr:PIN domain-containing protein [Candidatus Woesearchaeota archaeon]